MERELQGTNSKQLIQLLPMMDCVYFDRMSVGEFTQTSRAKVTEPWEEPEEKCIQQRWKGLTFPPPKGKIVKADKKGPALEKKR